MNRQTSDSPANFMNMADPLNPAFADVSLPDLAGVRGVIIQKALPGRRRASKHYI